MRRLRINKRVLLTQVMAVAIFVTSLCAIGSYTTTQQAKPTKYQKLKKIVWEKVSNNTKRSRISSIGWLVTFNEQTITFVPDPTSSWKIYEDKRKRRGR